MVDSAPVSVLITVTGDMAALEPRVLLRRRIASATRRIANQARVDVPVKTGNLGRSIREDPIVEVSPTVVESGVTAHAPYAAAVNYGSRAHLILPRRASVLRFEVEGRVVFARRVNHPGVKARPFLTNAARRILLAER